MLLSSSSSSSTLKLLPQLNKIVSNNTSSSSRCFFDSFFCACMQRHFPQSSHCITVPTFLAVWAVGLNGHLCPFSKAALADGRYSSVVSTYIKQQIENNPRHCMYHTDALYFNQLNKHMYLSIQFVKVFVFLSCWHRIWQMVDIFEDFLW